MFNYVKIYFSLNFTFSLRKVLAERKKMSTAMSIALAKVGLITEKQANDVVVLPRHLVPYQEQIEEISRLAGLMKANGVKESGMDVIVYLAFSADLSAGRYEEGYRLALSHLQQRVAELGLV